MDTKANAGMVHEPLPLAEEPVECASGIEKPIDPRQNPAEWTRRSAEGSFDQINRMGDDVADAARTLAEHIKHLREHFADPSQKRSEDVNERFNAALDDIEFPVHSIEESHAAASWIPATHLVLDPASRFSDPIQERLERID